MTLSRIVLLVACCSGCAGANRDARSGGDMHDDGAQEHAAFVASGTLAAAETSPTHSASVTRSVSTQSSAAARGAQERAPLRHFYLLSPGPNATLVVTRSDVATR